MPIDGDIILKAGLDTTGVSKSIGNLSKSISKGLKNAIRVAFGVRSVFALIRKIRSAVMEGFENLAQVHQPFNQAMSEIMTSLNLLKNTFAAAFAPIIETVAPILTTFINLIAKAVASVGQFIAALTGKEYVTAGQVQVDYAQSVDKSTKSTKSSTKATKAQTEAQKKLNREITHFDDLVILHEKEDTDKTTTPTTTTTPGAAFSTAPIGQAVNQFAKDFKAAWANADFTDIGRLVGEKVKDALEKIPWAGIKTTLSKVAKSSATFLNGYFETPGLYYTIGKTIAEGINSAFTFVYNFIYNFHWNSWGVAIRNKIKGALENIDWDLIYATFDGFGAGLADFLNALFDEDTFAEIGETVANLLNAALGALNNFGDEFDFEGFGKSLASGINRFLSKFDTERLTDGVNTFVIGFRDAIISFLSNIEWDELGIKIRNIILGINWKNVLLAVGAVIWVAINSAIEFFKGLFDTDNISTPFTEALNDLSETVSGIVDAIDFDAVSAGFKAIVDALTPAVESFGVGFVNVFNVLSKLGIIFLKQLGPALRKIGGAIQSVPAPIIESVGNALGTFVGAFVTFNGLTALGGIIKNTATHMGSLLGVLTKHPIIATALGLIALVSGLKSLSNSGFFADEDSKRAIENCQAVLAETQETRRGIQEFLDTAEGKDRNIEDTYGTIRNLANEYFELKGKVNLTAEEQSRLNTLENELTQQLPGFDEVIGNTTSTYDDQKTAVTELITQTEAYYKVLAAQEYLKEYYSKMFELDVAIQKNRDSHKELLDAYDGHIKTGDLVHDVVVGIGEAFDGNKQALDDNEAEYAKLLQQQKDLTAQYGAAETVLTNYQGALDDTSGSASNAETSTSGFAGAFDAFNGLSIRTPIKMALLSAAIKLLGESGSLSEEDVDALYGTLDDFNTNPTEENMKKIRKAFEDTGLSAEEFTDAVVTSYDSLDKDMQDQIHDVLTTIKSSSKKMKGSGEKLGEDFSSGYKGGIQDGTDDAVKVAGDLGDSSVDAVQDSIDSNSPSRRTRKLGVYFGQGLQLGMNDMKSKLVTTANTIITAIFNQMNTKLASFKTLGTQYMTKLNSGINSMSSTLSTTATTVITNMRTSISSLSFWNVGYNIGIGIYNGLIAQSNKLNTLAWNTAVGMYNSAKKALDIHSPSKKFAWIGEMVASGLGKGILDNQDMVVDAVTDMTDAMTQEAEKTNPAITISASIDDWIASLDDVLTTFSETIISRFDNMMNTLIQLSNVSGVIPAVAEGTVVPSSWQSASRANDNSTNMARMLENLTTNQVTTDDLRSLLVEMFTEYMNLGWYVGDEQLARHVNNGNLLLGRRYSK